MSRVSVKFLLENNTVAVALTKRNDALTVNKYAAMPASTAPAVEVDKNDERCVLDGIHRLAAAEIRGDEEIETWYHL